MTSDRNPGRGGRVPRGRIRPAPVRKARFLSSMLYRLRESFLDAPSALARAREISRELADWTSCPTPRMEPVTTAEQYAYALSAFDTARVYGNQAGPGVGPYVRQRRAELLVRRLRD